MIITIYVIVKKRNIQKDCELDITTQQKQLRHQTDICKVLLLWDKLY